MSCKAPLEQEGSLAHAIDTWGEEKPASGVLTGCGACDIPIFKDFCQKNMEGGLPGNRSKDVDVPTGKEAHKLVFLTRTTPNIRVCAADGWPCRSFNPLDRN